MNASAITTPLPGTIASSSVRYSRRTSVLVSLFCLAAFAPSSMPAAQRQEPIPVVVQRTVAVEGIVEATRDVLHEAYQKSETIHFPQGASLLSAYFDVPAGKRLIVETVSAIARLPNGQRALVSI